MNFVLSEIAEKYDDTCEQCESATKPIYHLKGNADNLDSMLCEECLQKLKNAINNY